MIGYSEVHALDYEQRERVEALFERRGTIGDLPEDLGKIEVWDEFIEDCERVGFPHLMASALFEQHTIFVRAGLAAQALDSYVRLMQLIRRHGDLVAPSNVSRMLNAVATATATLVDDPAVPLERITRVIDLVEDQMRLRGADLVGSYVARATVAAAAGDARKTFEWIDRWRAEASEEWRPDSSGVIQMEIPLIARFDIQRATDTLEQRLRILEIDVHRFDFGRADQEVRLRVMLAFFYVRLGRRQEANSIADGLLTALGIDDLAREAVLDYLIPVLEERPEAARIAVDHALRNIEFDETDWEITAAAARSRILADPAGEEGGLLRALADQAALAHDRRAGTDVHSLALQQFWWAGLPNRPRPDAVDNEAIWGDREERAEHILAAGWLPRTGAVNSDDPPIAIKNRYVALLGESMELLSAESAAEADDLADRLTARAAQLRCVTTRYLIPLLHGLRAGQNSDVVTLVDDYQRAQNELLTGYAWITDSILAIGEKVFSVVIEQAVATPEVSWLQIRQIVSTEAKLRKITGGPISRVTLARAEIASHRGDLESLQTTVEQLQENLRLEEGRLDRIDVDLEVVRLTVLHSPEFAESTAKWVTTHGDAEQIRAGSAWLCWMRARAGDRTAATELAALLDSVGGDVTSFGPLPGWVLLEGLGGADIDMAPVIDALLEEADTGAASDLLVFAAIGSALLTWSPADPRGPELRDRALRITRGLDARNGNPYWSSLVRDRWYPGDLAFGAVS